MNTETEPEPNQSVAPVDLRAELRRNLVAEFRSGLSSTVLSDNQQMALGELVDSGNVTATGILEALQT
jgi:hypothetical protein